MVICHSCDNPPCANPRHLWLGTHADNVRDKIAKGRETKPPIRFAESNNKTKLTTEQVELIRGLPNEYGAGAAMARKLGVSDEQVNRIRRGQARRFG